MATNTINKRKHTRFYPDPDDYALILSTAQGKPLKNPKICLLVQESSGGCKIVLTQEKMPVEGLVYLVQVGKQSALPAEIRWVKSIEPRVYSIGLQYIFEKPKGK